MAGSIRSRSRSTNSGAFRARALALWALLLLARPAAAADEPETSTLERAYAAEVRPLLARFCHRCHSGERTEAEIDLGSFESWGDVRRRPRTWQKVAEMLESGQMPPREARQPADAERARLLGWVKGYLAFEARGRAGDPGRVVLRRLSNAEYTYTLRDLTGVASLDPAREFPADGAAGEGFTNTGNALVMSPALLGKYLEAAKEVAAHAVLLPDGFRFSPHTTRRDWTEEILAQIRELYRQFTDAGGGDKVNLQGIVFQTNQGGRLPLERYLAATLEEREALMAGGQTLESVARRHGVNARYLAALWKGLSGREPSVLLDLLRARWGSAKPTEAAALAEEVARWQGALWKFSSVGHIGKVGGPKRWLEPVDPLAARRDFRLKLPEEAAGGEVTLSLIAADAGDGNDHDFVIWQRPRLVAPGRPDLLLRHVRDLTRDLEARRERILSRTAEYLSAAEEASSRAEADPEARDEAAELARKHGLEAEALRAWLDYLGIGGSAPVKVTGLFQDRLTGVGGYEFIKGWGSAETPSLVANSSDRAVRIPGNMRPHGVAVHPSPTLRALVGWRSPVTGAIRVEAKVTHAHPECGNGVTWALELRRGATRRRLAAGTAQGSTEVRAGPLEGLSVRTGDLVSLGIGPRDGNHSCDLTAIELKLAARGDGGKVWDLCQDVSGDVLQGNPHPDRFGAEGVWSFYTELDRGSGETEAAIPAGSLLSRWQTAGEPGEKQALAAALEHLLTHGPSASTDGPDAALYRQLASLGGPLLRGSLQGTASGRPVPPAGKREEALPEGPPADPGARASRWGLDPALFGQGAGGGSADPDSLSVRAPSVVEFRLPADLVAGSELVTTGALDDAAGAEGSVQLEVVAGKKGPPPAALRPGIPIVVREGSGARKRIESAVEEFRRLFPAALCYTKIVPVDEVVTLTLFHREDDHLSRLMLDEVQKERLDRLWDELHYVAQDALTLVDAFVQLMEYATQDADPKVFEPLRKPIHDRAAAFRQRLDDTQPKHLEALLDFAARAYRRPLAGGEAEALRATYRRLREESIAHPEAFRLTLARVLVGPAFLYRVEKPVPGARQGPVSDWELATRLSYFLWSSAPDEELRRMAEAGRLRDAATLGAQARRMLGDEKVRRLSIEFACHWLHIADFEHLDEKSERHFPTFAALRGAMVEESIRFFTDLFQQDAPVLDILDADHTFLDEALAKHYGIPGVSGERWRRVEGVKQYSRGGILAQATTLSRQSGASRTSPILRGNWISEVLLGERLPRPPKGVPVLPEDEASTEGLTVRELVERHSRDPKCAVCHQRIDAFGFALEGFDAIGRRREKDLGDRPIDTRARTMDGAELQGLDGLRGYLLAARRDAFVRQFCKKLLGYALGRAVQFSDEPLLSEMQAELKAKGYRVQVVVEAIVQSRQFREIRGRESAYNDDQ